MSGNSRRSIRDSSGEYPFCHKDALIQPSRRRCTVNVGNDDGSASFSLEVLPSSNSFVAPANVTEYFEKPCLVLNARRLIPMHQDGEKLYFIDVRYGERHDIAPKTWESRSLLLDRCRASFSGSDDLQLDMPCPRCPEERGYVARLSTLVAFLKGASNLSNWVDMFRNLDQPYAGLVFFSHLSR